MLKTLLHCVVLYVEKWKHSVSVFNVILFTFYLFDVAFSILRLKCDGTRADQISSFGRNGRVHLNRQGRQFDY